MVSVSLFHSVSRRREPSIRSNAPYNPAAKSFNLNSPNRSEDEVTLDNSHYRDKTEEKGEKRVLLLFYYFLKPCGCCSFYCWPHQLGAPPCGSTGVSATPDLRHFTQHVLSTLLSCDRASYLIIFASQGCVCWVECQQFFPHTWKIQRLILCGYRFIKRYADMDKRRNFHYGWPIYCD